MRLYSCPCAGKGRVNIYSFKLILQVNVPFQVYIVFYRDFLVQMSPSQLWSSTVSEYVCRRCHGLLRKRNNLQQNLEELKKSMTINYIFPWGWAWLHIGYTCKWLLCIQVLLEFPSSGHCNFCQCTHLAD